eukprot:gene11431-25904_t
MLSATRAARLPPVRLTRRAASVRVAPEHRLESLPEELWVVIFGFVKHDEAPARYVFVCGVACAAAVVILADYMHALPGASRQQTGTSTSALDASPSNLNPTHTKLQTDTVLAIDRILNSTKLQLSRAERLFVQAATEAGVGSPDTKNTEGAQVLPRDIMQQLKTELKAEMK